MTVFSVKAIKPASLKVSAVRLELLNALRKEGTVQKNLLKGTTKYWEGDKPTFVSEISLAGNDAVLLVGASGSTKGAEKWQYLDDGTKAYWVYPRRAKMLRFRPGHTSGSRPGTLDVKPSRSYGDYVYSRGHRVSGIKARGWTKVVLKQRYKPFRERMNVALTAGLQKGGWK